jgi:hypothetical protein
MEHDSSLVSEFLERVEGSVSEPKYFGKLWEFISLHHI